MRLTYCILIMVGILLFNGCRSEGTSGSDAVPTSKVVLNAKFVEVPSGQFMMGSPESELGHEAREGPQHKVSLESFQIMATELTQAQWKSVMGSVPSTVKGDSLPVGNVSWDDVQNFIAKLNTIDPDMNYRLPTEAEWEYACRAGSTTSYCYGDDPAKLQDYAWVDVRRTIGVQPVGKKLANAWGIYDMHGNAIEWCADEFKMYDEPDQRNPFRARVIRSDGFNPPPSTCRSAYRGGTSRDLQVDFIGFRLVKPSQ